jgi:hypothetical protein
MLKQPQKAKKGGMNKVSNQKKKKSLKLKIGQKAQLVKSG